jgi:hypothetical protein
MSSRHLWFFTVQRAADVEGQWVSHCLDIDVVTQGTSLKHAIDMLCEAVTIVVRESDLSRHTAAPPEDWELLFSVQKTGDRLSISSILDRPQETVGAVAGQLVVTFSNFSVTLVETYETRAWCAPASD